VIEKRVLWMERWREDHPKLRSCFWRWPWGHVRPAVVTQADGLNVKCAVPWCEHSVWVGGDI